MLARLEGILLDPVYTGKGMAGFIDLVRKGHFKKGQNVVFIHTGGSVGLFGYVDVKAVKRGETGQVAQRQLAEFVHDLVNRSDLVLIACRELSVISGAMRVPYVDSLDVLAADIVVFAA